MLSYLWGGKNKATKPENENPELAMRDQLDAHGEFGTKADGTMELKDYLVLRAIITRQSCRAFAPLKAQFKQKQFDLYKSNDQQGYINNFVHGQRAYNESILFMTKKACEWIEFDYKNYIAT